LSSVWKYLAAVGIGAIITYSLIRPRLEALESKVSGMERGINQINARVVEFESRYRATVPQLQYEYLLIRRDVDELKKSALTLQQKFRLEETMRLLDQATIRKLQQRPMEAR